MAAKGITTYRTPAVGTPLASMEQGAGRLAPEFWSSPVVASAVASCDAATLLEEIRRAHGWSQKQLALAVGYSQSWVSNVLRRRQVLTVDQVREVSRQLGIPVHLLRFGDAGSDDQTRRRDFGKAMALALVPLPMRAVVDETTAPALTAITGAQRRLDATTSSRNWRAGSRRMWRWPTGSLSVPRSRRR